MKHSVNCLLGQDIEKMGLVTNDCAHLPREHTGQQDQNAIACSSDGDNFRHVLGVRQQLFCQYVRLMHHFFIQCDVCAGK